MNSDLLTHQIQISKSTTDGPTTSLSQTVTEFETGKQLGSIRRYEILSTSSPKRMGMWLHQAISLVTLSPLVENSKASRAPGTHGHVSAPLFATYYFCLSVEFLGEEH